ncbi:prolipoprotein diacylglyceryl transferase [Gemella sp. GH3]|uniref:prolipoprotein diacylglyceryl transferase n=1 Tax=unclassified Gemella TaxID=2624949 RepID=UPI0015D097CB|nr:MULTISPECIES: prolipoprotein diacylglyceryl transferase [unclassified Gemella]MBF0713310.1 prolipoprotein diacylglyceryl transferase [Gemella sp. GH3.1]NYS50262.1 prolipoprotein diacylglyceryl transferase [Gemella sp. GH3]
MSDSYINPIAFYAFSKPIYWYGIIISVAIFISYYLAEREARKRGLPNDKILDLLLLAVPVAFIFARLYYVIFSWDYYSNNINKIVAIWDGGIAIYGGLIGGLIVIYLFSKRNNISTLKLLDIIAPSLLIGQAIGRWGNFFNHEAYGDIVSKETLQSLLIPDFIIQNMYIEGAYHQPTFLYESLWCLVAFFILILMRKYLYRGEVLTTYMILYGVERYFVEGLREDSLYIGAFRVSQLVSLLLVLIGISFILYNRLINKKEKKLYINS